MWSVCDRKMAYRLYAFPRLTEQRPESRCHSWLGSSEVTYISIETFGKTGQTLSFAKSRSTPKTRADNSISMVDSARDLFSLIRFCTLQCRCSTFIPMRNGRTRLSVRGICKGLGDGRCFTILASKCSLSSFSGEPERQSRSRYFVPRVARSSLMYSIGLSRKRG